MTENNNVRMGFRDGMPIGVGYFAMSFAFGIYSVALGLTPLEAMFISMFNLTSAGQIAAVPIIAGGGSLISLVLTQLVINARYALMSISLSQRLGKSVKLVDRFPIAFFNTDEIFAISCAKESLIGRKYLYAIAVIPYLSWTLGTLAGAVAGNILPEIITNSLSVLLYAIFIAILMPPAKAAISNSLAIVSAVVLSSLFYFLPVLKSIPLGVVIIIITVAVSAIFALIAPVEDLDPWHEEVDSNV
ncbi:MAG: AzlC family ABC transporter permease [Clostridia bacterium]|nr:AzlC family ABC transporter permease [Clostridia bacterium]